MPEPAARRGKHDDVAEGVKTLIPNGHVMLIDNKTLHEIDVIRSCYYDRKTTLAWQQVRTHLNMKGWRLFTRVVPNFDNSNLNTLVIGVKIGVRK